MEQSKMNLKGNMPNTTKALQGIKTNTTIDDFGKYHLNNGSSLLLSKTDKPTFTKDKNIEVIAGGGIKEAWHAEYYKALGADHVSIGTGCFNPLKTWRTVNDIAL